MNCEAIIAAQPHPLIFATISGAHLYGFPSPDSDVDLRGVHVLPLRELVGLDTGPETVESNGAVNGRPLDLVTHEVRKFMRLMLRPNGYVLEQLWSPLVVHTTCEHEQLMALGRECLTRNHADHYLGFAATQRRLLERDTPPRVKPVLYVYRVLLTGIHLMQSGALEANLVRLNERFGFSQVSELIARKGQVAEHCTLEEREVTLHSREFDRLTAQLEIARSESQLPSAPTARPGLQDLLLRIRLGKHR